MSDYQKEMEVFKTYLRKSNLKVTSQRLLVAKKIFEIHHHFSAESLMDEFKDKRDEISKATIYRILGIMVEANLLTEHNFGHGFKYYEHIIGHVHHDHIICLDCGRIEEFLDDRIEELQEKAAMDKGFVVEGHKLNIYGRCKNGPTCKHLKKRH